MSELVGDDQEILDPIRSFEFLRLGGFISRKNLGKLVNLFLERPSEMLTKCGLVLAYLVSGSTIRENVSDHVHGLVFWSEAPLSGRMYLTMILAWFSGSEASSILGKNV